MSQIMYGTGIYLSFFSPIRVIYNGGFYTMANFGGRNNTIFYYSPIHTMGGKSEVTTALAILRGFNVVVVGVHTGSDLLILNKVIAGAKAQNSNQEWYGYVAFGSTGSGVSATAADQWMTDCPPSSGLLDGIFLDEFGHDFASGTRDQQNAIVNYCHDTLNDGSTTGLPVFINPWICTDVFGQPPGNVNNATPVVGSHATHTDLILVESFLWNVNDTVPVSRGDWTRDKGRMEYYLQQRDNNSKKIKICAMMGVGRGTGVSPNTELDEDEYKDAISYLEGVGCNYVCVNHGDLGATSKTFFIQHKQNQFPLVLASGTHPYRAKF